MWCYRADELCAALCPDVMGPSSFFTTMVVAIIFRAYEHNSFSRLFLFKRVHTIFTNTIYIHTFMHQRHTFQPSVALAFFIHFHLLTCKVLKWWWWWWWRTVTQTVQKVKFLSRRPILKTGVTERNPDFFNGFDVVRALALVCVCVRAFMLVYIYSMTRYNIMKYLQWYAVAKSGWHAVVNCARV